MILQTPTLPPAAAAEDHEDADTMVSMEVRVDKVQDVVKASEAGEGATSVFSARSSIPSLNVQSGWTRPRTSGSSLASAKTTKFALIVSDLVTGSSLVTAMTTASSVPVAQTSI